VILLKEKLYILHESGAPRHFESLLYLNKKKNIFSSIEMLEFSVFKQLARGILGKNLKLVKKAFYNTLYLIYFLLTRNKTIILGAAPYDIFIFYLIILKKRHKVIYYSSWPYWEQTSYPKKIYNSKQFKLWEKFLSNIKAVGVTPPVKAGLEKYTKDVTVIPHCVDTNVFYGNKHSENQQFRVLYVGRIIPEKGINELIDIIQQLPNEIEFWFVGDGPLKDQVLKLQSNKNNVKYLGQIKKQTELADIYRKCTTLVLPSKSVFKWEELFGIVLIEAMSCGVVPISSKCVGPKTIISNEFDGFLVDEASKSQIMEKIELLKNNLDKRNKMSTSAIQKVKDKYDIDKTALLWEKVLQK
jgi:glycosyltransferase involved in cell wall biosynthesis